MEIVNERWIWHGGFHGRFVLLALLVSALAVLLAASEAEGSPHGPGRIYYEYGQERRILNNPNVELYPGARRDIASGMADPAVMDVIEYSASRYPIVVSAIKTGHPYSYAPTLRALGMPGYPNAHHYGWAIDIAYVNGAPVSSANPQARYLARRIHQSRAFAVQDLGSPWLFGGPRSFTDSMHKNHLHVGWTYAH